jgi:hypothetical protein
MKIIKIEQSVKWAIFSTHCTAQSFVSVHLWLDGPDHIVFLYMSQSNNPDRNPNRSPSFLSSPQRRRYHLHLSSDPDPLLPPRPRAIAAARSPARGSARLLAGGCSAYLSPTRHALSASPCPSSSSGKPPLLIQHAACTRPPLHI